MYKFNFNLLNICSSLFKSNGLPSGRLEAEILLSFSLGVPRESLPLYINNRSSYKLTKYFMTLAERRVCLGEPIAYIMESKEFYSLSFYVNHNVLIPRPETELISEYITKQSNDLFLGNDINYLDLCTGSGCILNTVLKETISPIQGAGLDVSSDALKVASKNKKMYRLSAFYYRSDLSEVSSSARYKVISVNPPYIPSLEVFALNREVRLFEPMLSLRAGLDGLDFYRSIAKILEQFICTNGLFITEIGLFQKESVVSILGRKGYVLYDTLNDLSSRERVLIFKSRR